MKGIFLFFATAFLCFGIAVVFYETQIAAPRAGAITQSSQGGATQAKLEPKPVNPPQAEQANPAPAPAPATNIASNTLTVTDTPKAAHHPKPIQRTQQNRIIDLNTPIANNSRERKAQEALLKSLDQAVQRTIQESIGLDIQKAVATELTRQLNEAL